MPASGSANQLLPIGERVQCCCTAAIHAGRRLLSHGTLHAAHATRQKPPRGRRCPLSSRPAPKSRAEGANRQPQRGTAADHQLARASSYCHFCARSLIQLRHNAGAVRGAVASQRRRQRERDASITSNCTCRGKWLLKTHLGRGAGTLVGSDAVGFEV